MVESLKVVSVLLVTGLVVECRMHVSVHLKVPRYVLLGSHVLLKCEYNVEKDQLHKVEWLKHGHKIFQFVNGRKPPFRNFTLHGAQIDWAQSNEQQVRLKILDFDASGIYSCEVTTETPIYTKASEDEEVTVIKKQIEDPTITYWKTEYTVGERLEVNCTSGQSRPTPEVTWLLNGKQADEQWIRTFPEQRPSSVTVQLSMELKEEHVPELELTCLSTIPGFMGHHVRHTDYADHRRYVMRVGVLAAEPIISADSRAVSSSLGYPIAILTALFLLRLNQRILLWI
ncbi:uncharacterized protein LOC128993320 [Macrosteles quadrilineatus]|uniref:uncharacterized protein LOC128993320 n=1 Tax=Macrosteles quadrilineatus TaxID=74068 RepID=UPI0023E2380D|nr:uncharacterized protein LOC128993320 [Macrosteles quadrilineatus]